MCDCKLTMTTSYHTITKRRRYLVFFKPPVAEIKVVFEETELLAREELEVEEVRVACAADTA